MASKVEFMRHRPVSSRSIMKSSRTTRSARPKVVLAYSGGLDTSIILHWLKEEKGCDVIAFCADLGQGEDLPAIRKKALQVGATKAYVEDLREEFVSDYVFPMLRGNAVYESSYLLGTSIARPLIAKRQVELAKKEKASFLSHGATGKGNDQVRFELTFAALAPNVQVIAPWREWSMASRQDLIDYAQQHRIPITVTKAKPYSMDANLLHISYEGGVLEDPWVSPPKDMFQMTTSPQDAPSTPQTLTLQFQKGDPIGVNDKLLSPATLLHRLNQLGGKHGIGRVDLVENRFVGLKSRGVYETPGGTILHIARRALESLTLDREVVHLRDSLMPRYAELVYNGFWFSPERLMLQAAFDRAQQNVTGTVRVQLYKGNCTITGRKSDRSLYQQHLATFEEGSGYDQQDAGGFIRLNALRLATRAAVQKPKW
jgi:argininosuccinate synthase